MQRTYLGHLIQWLFLAHAHIHDHLWENLQVGDKLMQRLAGALHDVEDQQRG